MSAHGSHDEAGASQLILACGPRDAESALLQILDDEIPHPLPPELLRRPVWVVVPSRALADHVAARLVAHRGHAVAGCAVLTLARLAGEIVQRAGQRAAPSRAAYELRLRWAFAEEASLESLIRRHPRAFRAARQSVRDLVDALHEPLAPDELDEITGELPEHARALVRVAATLHAEASDPATPTQRIPVDPDAAPMLRARRVLETGDPADLLPARCVIFHGIANAPGTRLDLVEAVCRAVRARVVVDVPRLPERAGEAGGGFTARLLERLAWLETVERPAAVPTLDPRLVEAADEDAEARFVAERVRALLDAEPALPPERIGVVARDAQGYGLRLARAFRRRGIPYAAPFVAGTPTAALRTLAAQLAVLERGPEAPVTRWLEAFGAADGEDGLLPSEARLALAVVGVARLGELAALDLTGHGERIRLPVGTRDTPDEDESRPRSASVPADALRRLAARAGTTLEGLGPPQWPERAATRAHLDALGQLLRDVASGAKPHTFIAAARELAASFPEDRPVERDEVLVVLRRAFENAVKAELTESRGGVRILGAMHARGLTFDHLFLVGLRRDAFPRLVREDALVGDGARRVLRQVLPDVPVKREGVEEERWLFASLLSSSPSLTLTWPKTFGGGQAATPSPLVMQLARGLGLDMDDATRVPSHLGLGHGPALRDGAPRPALEAAIAAGLHGDRETNERLVAVASRDADFWRAESLAEHEHARLAATRARVASEMDRIDGRDLGPYLGTVGPARSPSRAPWVTRLQGQARCAWQAFLERELRVRPMPDPLEALPAHTPALVGSVVHGALASVLRRAGARAHVALAVILDDAGTAWPSRAAIDVEGALLAAAREVLREEGVGTPGFEHVLARVARPFVERALDLTEAERANGLMHLGAEIEGRADVPLAEGESAPLRFRADRVDRAADGSLRLVDYKTGGPVTRVARGDRREKRILEALESGEILQGATYASAVEPAGAGVYLHLAADLDDAVARVAIEADDEAARAVFADAHEILRRAFEAGVNVPRLVAHDLDQRPRACSYCDVREACVQGSSAARRRLVAFLESDTAEDDPTHALARALHERHGGNEA
jgi:hypothetical protein